MIPPPAPDSPLIKASDIFFSGNFLIGGLIFSGKCVFQGIERGGKMRSKYKRAKEYISDFGCSEAINAG